MDIIFFALGLIIGLFASYAIFHLINKSKSVTKSEYDNLLAKFNEATLELKHQEEQLRTLQIQNQSQFEKINTKDLEAIQLQTKLASLETNISNTEAKVLELTTNLNSHSEINKNQQIEINTYRQKIAELTANYNNNLENLNSYKIIIEKQTQEITEFNTKINQFSSEASTLKANNSILTEKLISQKSEMESLQKTAHLQFEKIANQIFEEKSNKFTENNRKNIEALLTPLKDDIGKFKIKVEETYNKESKERYTLESKVKELIEQTNKISAEANNLATALKGQIKKQGNWGEMILERILEASGLTKDREYFVQQTIKDEEGKNLRPDVLINLPDNRIIIIDSKVSLVAYDRFAATQIVEDQKIYLNEHLKSIYGHINDLSEKKYDNLENSLDFTMMFIPIEPAYLISIQSDQDLWEYAYSKRILLISPTNLIACLKLISDLWNREKQNKNAMNIVKRGELLYEKFITFLTSLEDVGKHIGKTQMAYNAAIDQLKNGRGNLVNQAIHLKSLGLKSSKKIPPSMLPLDYEEPEIDIEKNDTE